MPVENAAVMLAGTREGGLFSSSNHVYKSFLCSTVFGFSHLRRMGLSETLWFFPALSVSVL